MFICGAVGRRLGDLCLCPEDICRLHVNSIQSIVDSLRTGVPGSRQKNRERGTAKAPPFIERRGVAIRSDITKLLWARESALVARAYQWAMTLRRQNFPGCGMTVLVRLRGSDSLPPGIYLYSQPRPEIGALLDVLEQCGVSVAEDIPATLSIRLFQGTSPCSAMYIVRRKTEKTCFTEYSNRLYGETMSMGSMERGVQPACCGLLDVGMRNGHKYVVDLRWKAGDLLKDCIAAVPKIRGLKAAVWHNDQTSYALEESVVAWIHGTGVPLDPRVTVMDHTAELFEFAFRTERVSRSDLPEPPDRTRSYFACTYVEGKADVADAVIGRLPRGSMRMGYPGDVDILAWYELPWLAVGCDPTPLSEGRLVSGVQPGPPVDTRAWDNTQTSPQGGQVSALVHTLYYSCINQEYSIMVTHIQCFDQKPGSGMRRL